jgi:O-antigen/teichoic acid export membrane protein
MDKVDQLSRIDTPPVSFERNLLTIAKGGSIVYGGKLFLALSRLVTVFLLARILSAEQYGLYNLALSTATVAMGIALLGLDDALVRYIAIYASRRDEGGIWGALQVCVGFSTLLSVVTGTGLFALAYPISELVFRKPELAPLLQVTSTIIPFLVLSEVLAGATRGFNKMHYMVIAQHIAQPVIRFVLILIVSLTGLNPTWAILTFGIADGAASILFLIFLRKHLPVERTLSVNRQNIKTLFGFSLPLWLSDLMFNFRTNIQTILLGSLNTVTSVGIFSVISQVNVVGQMLFSSIAVSTRPMIAELHDRGDYKQLGHVYQTTTKWVMMINLPFFLVMVLYPVPVLSIFGKSFVNGAEALVILAFANLVNIGTGMCGSIVDMTGYSKLKLLNTFIRLLSSLGLNILLIPIWGIIGAAFAALFVEIIVNFIILIEIWILFRLVPYNGRFINLLVAGSAAFIAGFLMNRFFPSRESLIHLTISLVTTLSFYVFVYLIMGLAPEDRLLISRLQRRLSAYITSN